MVQKVSIKEETLEINKRKITFQVHILVIVM